MQQLQMHSAASFAAPLEEARAGKGLFVVEARLNNRLVETAAVQPALALQTAGTGSLVVSNCSMFQHPSEGYLERPIPAQYLRASH